MLTRDVLKTIEDHTIGDLEDYAEAHAILGNIAREATAFKTSMTEQLAPLKEAFDKAKAPLNEQYSILDKAEGLLKDKIAVAAVASKLAYEAAVADYQAGKIRHEDLVAAEARRLPEKTEAASVAIRRIFYVADLDALPAKFKTQRVIIDVDNNAIERDLNDGLVVPGVDLSYVGTVRVASRK
jgi:hypothetical protein